jgi:hypothetical protein
MVNARPGEGPVSPLGARTPLPATHLPGRGKRTEYNESQEFSQLKQHMNIVHTRTDKQTDGHAGMG